MAGACVGFLMHNRYKASIFMGDTGALALGGALAAMASCRFPNRAFPLFLSSGVFVLEAVSVIAQVYYSLDMPFVHVQNDIFCYIILDDEWMSNIALFSLTYALNH